MSTPSERINLIREIAARLSNEEWPLIDLTLGQFGLPTVDSFEGDKLAYVIRMVSDADGPLLVELARHVEYEGSADRPAMEPSFWTPGCFRLFASHLSTQGLYTSALKDALAAYQISTFVAHMDIEPTSEWEDEIQLALSTADALVALLHPDFHQSNWTDQEVGFVMGRGRLAVAVRLGAAPYGFVGKLQAFDGREKTGQELARDIFGAFVRNKQTNQQMARALLTRFEQSDSFREAQRNMLMLETITYWEPQFEPRLRSSAKSNEQIFGAIGVLNRIDRLVDKWNPRPSDAVIEPEDIPFE